jgi:hypothetical protein
MASIFRVKIIRGGNQRPSGGDIPGDSNIQVQMLMAFT